MTEIAIHRECFDSELITRRLRTSGTATKHALGQHFLLDPEVVKTLVIALGQLKDTHVYEVGAGIGTLTYSLASQAHHVTALEFDVSLKRELLRTLHGVPNVDIVFGDALVYPFPDNPTDQWMVAGNIPYSITGPLLELLLERTHPPVRIVFMVQREVAERLAAPPGDWGIATLATRLFADVALVGPVIPASEFFPPPKVASRLIQITPVRHYDKATSERIMEVARAVFQFRRKTLRQGLKFILGSPASADTLCARMHLDSTRRPQTLNLDEWVELSANVAELKSWTT